MCPTLNISGKCPTSKRFLNILHKGNDIGVAINAINFPETPPGTPSLQLLQPRHLYRGLPIKPKLINKLLAPI